MHEYYRVKKYTGERYIDLIGLITNPVGTLLGPTGLGVTGGGSAVAPGGVLAPGSEMAAIASAKMAQDTQRETNSFNSDEAKKSRDWSSSEATTARDYNTTEAIASRGFNSAEAQKNRDFQASQVLDAQKYNTAMSSSAYQRSMADMKKAGLNPMLSYMQGGASTPQSPTGSGSAASGSAASTSAPGSSQATGQQSAMAEVFQRGIQNTISSGYEGQRLRKELQVKDADIGERLANKNRINASTARELSEKRRIDVDTKQKERDIKFGKIGGWVPEEISNGYDALKKNFWKFWNTDIRKY